MRKLSQILPSHYKMLVQNSCSWICRILTSTKSVTSGTTCHIVFHKIPGTLHSCTSMIETSTGFECSSFGEVSCETHGLSVPWVSHAQTKSVWNHSTCNTHFPVSPQKHLFNGTWAPSSLNPTQTDLCWPCFHSTSRTSSTIPFCSICSRASLRMRNASCAVGIVWFQWSRTRVAASL